MVIDKSFLQSRYVEDGKSSNDIARELGTSQGNVMYWVRKYGLPRRPRGRNDATKNIAGQRIGRVMVISQSAGNGKCAVWKCECDCGVTEDISWDYLRHPGDKMCSECRSKRPSNRWMGCGEIGASVLCELRYNAKARGLNVSQDITVEFLWEMFLQQGRKCAMTGCELTFKHSDGATERTASVDRIDPDGDYTPGNIRWVHKLVNVMRWDMRDDEYFEWCKRVCLHNGVLQEYGTRKTVAAALQDGKQRQGTAVGHSHRAGSKF